MAAPRVGRADRRESLGSHASRPQGGLTAAPRAAAVGADNASAKVSAHMKKRVERRSPRARAPLLRPAPNATPHPDGSTDIALSSCNAPIRLRLADQHAARAPASRARASVSILDVQGFETRHRPRLAA
jgi:hypothetical protein